MNAPDVHIQIQALRDGFAERVRVELMELDDLLATPLVGSSGLQRARSVLQILHHMAGDARTLGLYRLRQESKVLEEALRPVVEAYEASGDRSRALLGSTFAEHVRALGELLEADLRSRVPNSVLEAYNTPKEVYRRPQPEEPEAEASEPEVSEPAAPEPEELAPKKPEPEAPEPEVPEPVAAELEEPGPEELELEELEPDVLEPTELELGEPEPEASGPEASVFATPELEEPEPEELKQEEPEPKVSEPEALEPPELELETEKPEKSESGRLQSERLESAALDYELLAPEMFGAETETPPSEPQTEAEASQPDIPLVEPSWVVLLEPDALTAKRLTVGMQRKGYEVQWLSDMDGLEAFASQAGTDTPVTVVADVAFAQALADAPFMQTSAFLPVIYLSNKDTFDLRYNLAKSRAGGFFVRPIELPLLVERIERQMAEANTQRGRVLVVGDDEELGGHYQAVLRKAGFEAATISNPQDCFIRLAEFRPDILLMDTPSGRYSSEILTRTIRLQPEWQDLPIIHLLSAKARGERVAAPFDGLDDIMAKPVSGRQLVHGVRARCIRARRVNRLMARDSLTGVLNHHAIKQELADEVARIRRNSRNAVVAIVDLDDLDIVNARYGYPQGDRVIRTLANLLGQRLRRTDRVGRYGGEEFVVVLPDCDELDAWAVLEEIRRHFASLVFRCDRGSFRVTLSVGMVQLGEFPSADAALLSADRALHSRKEAGKDGVAVFS